MWIYTQDGKTIINADNVYTFCVGLEDGWLKVLADEDTVIAVFSEEDNARFVLNELFEALAKNKTAFVVYDDYIKVDRECIHFE